MTNLTCISKECGWRGTYEDAIFISEEDLEVLKLVLFTEKIFLKKKGYDDLRLIKSKTLYVCPECYSPWLMDSNKSTKEEDTTETALYKAIQEIKLNSI